MQMSWKWNPPGLAEPQARESARRRGRRKAAGRERSSGSTAGQPGGNPPAITGTLCISIRNLLAAGKFTLCAQANNPTAGTGRGPHHPPARLGAAAGRCHVDLVSPKPQHSGTARRCRIPPGCPAEDVPARWACRKDGEGPPVPPRAGPAPWWRGAGTRCHPLAAPRRLQLPVPTPAPRRGIKERRRYTAAAENHHS